MACMEKRSGHRQTRNRFRLASSWLSLVLAPSITAKERWQTND
jgi:hypothetical protein